MRQFKRLIAMLLSVLLIITSIPATALTAFAAAADDVIDGIYTYTVNDSEATITKCSADAEGDIDIPNTLGGYSVVAIGARAFNDCDSLTSITIPDSVKSVDSPYYIYDGVFANCDMLKTVVIGNGMKTIPKGMFYNCGRLETVTLGNKVETIEESAFQDCSAITDVYYLGTEIEWKQITIGSNNECLTNATIHYGYLVDSIKPTGNISSTNNLATIQTVTIAMNDETGIAGYYWGTNSNYENNTYTAVLGAPKNMTASNTISAEGTYYLTVKDTSGNVSEIYSVTFYKTDFNANGGNVALDYVITKSGNGFTVPTPTKSNSEFEGWAVGSEGSANYRVGATYMPNMSLTLCAVWKSSAKLGDINQDGVIDSADAGLILRYDAGLVALNAEQLALADVNKDGAVDSGDSGLILRFDAGLITAFN